MSTFDGLPLTLKLAHLLRPDLEFDIDSCEVQSDVKLPAGWQILTRSSDVMMKRLIWFYYQLYGNLSIAQATGIGGEHEIKAAVHELKTLEGLLIQRALELTGRIDLLDANPTIGVWKGENLPPDQFLIIWTTSANSSA